MIIHEVLGYMLVTVIKKCEIDEYPKHCTYLKKVFHNTVIACEDEMVNATTDISSNKNLCYFFFILLLFLFIIIIVCKC